MIQKNIFDVFIRVAAAIAVQKNVAVAINDLGDRRVTPQIP